MTVQQHPRAQPPVPREVTPGAVTAPGGDRSGSG